MTEIEKKSKLLLFWKGFLDGWKNYFKISGRTSRINFWSFTLISFVILTAILITLNYNELNQPLPHERYEMGEDFNPYSPGDASGKLMMSFLTIFVQLIFMIPFCTCLVRRMHDRNMSGRSVFWWFVIPMVLTPLMSFLRIFHILNMVSMPAYDLTEPTIQSSTMQMWILYLTGVPSIIMVITGIVFLIFCMIKGNDENNRYVNDDVISIKKPVLNTLAVLVFAFIMCYWIVPAIVQPIKTSDLHGVWANKNSIILQTDKLSLFFLRYSDERMVCIFNYYPKGIVDLISVKNGNIETSNEEIEKLLEMHRKDQVKFNDNNDVLTYTTFDGHVFTNEQKEKLNIKNLRSRHPNDKRLSTAEKIALWGMDQDLRIMKNGVIFYGLKLKEYNFYYSVRNGESVFLISTHFNHELGRSFYPLVIVRDDSVSVVDNLVLSFSNIFPNAGELFTHERFEELPENTQRFISTDECDVVRLRLYEENYVLNIRRNEEIPFPFSLVRRYLHPTFNYFKVDG